VAEALHSTFSASAAARWLACPGSIVLSQGIKDSTSRHAAEGTVAHGLLEAYLVRSEAPETRVGEYILQDGFSICVEQDMVDALRRAITAIDEMTRLADTRQAETRVNYAQWLGVERDQAWGTADLIAVFAEARELLVGDLKFGRGVEVSAVENEQMMLYAGGALLEMDALGIDIDTVRLVIYQPRITDTPSEWAISRAELETWLTGRARSGAISVTNAQGSWRDIDGGLWDETYLSPGEKQCRWCRAKAAGPGGMCPALRAEVADTVFDQVPASPDDFENLTIDNPAQDNGYTPEWLAACLSKVDLIEDWCKAVRAEAERRLCAGEPVPGYKLVQGKRGNRSWGDPAAAEAQLKAMRLKTEEMYDLKLISPPSAEKLAKAKIIGPRQWPKLQALITQTEGKPHVAPASDPRPPITVQPVEEAFEVQADKPTYPSAKDEASFEDIC
jgi:Protein of unknown function (DUF2800)